MAGPQLASDEQGNIWDVSDPAHPRFVSARQGGGPNVVMPAPPPEPKFIPGMPGKVLGPSGAAQDIPGITPPPPSPTFVPGKPGVVMTGPTSAAPISGLPQELPQDQNSSVTRAAAIQGYSYAKQLQTTIDDLTTLYNAGPGSTKGVEGLKDYLPYTGNQAFDTKANAARGIVGQSLGFTGGQLNTAQEAEKAVGPYLPQSSDRDAVILQKIKTLQDLADEAKAKAIQQLGGEPDENGNIHPVQSQGPAAPVQPPADPVTHATGATRTQIDPMLRAIGQKVGGMLSSGVGDDQIRKYLSDSGVDPGSTNVGRALQFRHSPDFKKWQRHNPGQAYPIGPEFYTKQVPMSDARQLFNKTAATDVGGNVAAGLAASANAISGGRLDNMVADPEMARTGMDLLRGQHPTASFVGDVAGQASLEALAGTVPGAQGLMATRWGRRGADAMYGAYSGSGEGEDAGVGALTGAASGLGFGMFGRGAQKGLGRAAVGVKNAHLQYLDKLGVPLTIGQIGRGSENIGGRFVGGLEERAAGLPGLDAIINTARKRGDVGFNQAAFRQMPGHSGTIGAQGIDEGHKLVGDAYRFLDPVNLPLDAQYAGSQAGVRASLPDLPAFGGEIDKSLNLLDKQATGGVLTGRDWQSGIRGVRGARSSIAGQPFGDPAVGAMNDVESNLMGLAQRQGPVGTVDNLAGANKLNGQFQTIASALDNGPAQRADEMFSASRLDDASRAGARNYGGRVSSMAGKRPFYDLTTAGRAVMPNLTPDSGTAGRMMLPFALAGIGGAGVGAVTGENKTEGSLKGLGYGALAAAALSAPYNKSAQKVIQKALLAERPDLMEKLGKILIKHPRAAGMFGSSVGRDYFFQPEISQ